MSAFSLSPDPKATVPGKTVLETKLKATAGETSLSKLNLIIEHTPIQVTKQKYTVIISYLLLECQILINKM